MFLNGMSLGMVFRAGRGVPRRPKVDRGTRRRAVCQLYPCRRSHKIRRQLAAGTGGQRNAMPATAGLVFFPPLLPFCLDALAHSPARTHLMSPSAANGGRMSSVRSAGRLDAPRPGLFFIVAAYLLVSIVRGIRAASLRPGNLWTGHDGDTFDLRDFRDRGRAWLFWWPTDSAYSSSITEGLCSRRLGSPSPAAS